VFTSKIKLEDLRSLRLKRLPQRHAARASRCGAERARGGGRGLGARPRCRACTFIWLFFLHAERGGARTKITPILGKNHARVEIIDLKSKPQASARDFAYLVQKWLT
jgi:hypothetical protein